MKKTSFKHLSIALCLLMIFVQFAPVFADSPPVDDGTGVFSAGSAITQEAETSASDGVEAQHMPSHWWHKKYQPAPEGLYAVAPTSEANNDGKIVGVTRAMEYKKLTDKHFIPVKRHVIKGLSAGTYQVRYKAKPGYWPGAVVTGDVPPYVAHNQDQEAPRGLAAMAPTTSQNNDGMIMGTTSAMEYMMEGADTWIPATEHHIQGLEPGVYHIRYAAKEGYNASEHVMVTVPAYAEGEPGTPVDLTGVAPTTADNSDGKITGTTIEMEYMLEGSDAWIPATESEITGLEPGVYHVRCAASADTGAGEHVIVIVPAFTEDNQDQEAPTGLAAVAPTAAEAEDGMITGTTIEMEYMMEGAATWTSVTDTQIEGLAPGVYHVRYAAKEGYNAGAAAEVTVPEV